MPKVGTPARREDDGDDRVRSLAFFAGFKRSKKGNLSRQWEGRSLTVFRRKDGTFAWCIADDDGPTYSEGTFEDEREAIRDLRSVVCDE